jgi:hypothetical protein
MNPGLIPPADVAATAKKGLELREKFQPRWDFSWDSSRTTAGGASKRILSRHTAISTYFARHEVVRQATNGRRNRPLGGLSGGCCGAASPAADGQAFMNQTGPANRSSGRLQNAALIDTVRA